MNPKKCAFGVTAGQFLGFLVHEHGIEVGDKSRQAIQTMVPHSNKTELQSLIGKINYIRRFISNLSGRIEPFMPLVKLKNNEAFVWGLEQQKAFDDIKDYLASPPTLVPPQLDNPFIVYLSADAVSIGSVLIQEFEGKEWVVFYLSRRLLDAETRYSDMERLCLCLYFTCTKLRHNLLHVETRVVCKADIVKHMLSAPILKGRLGKWMYALSKFDCSINPRRQSRDRLWQISSRKELQRRFQQSASYPGCYSLMDQCVILAAVLG
jgi:hypothetical protein